MSTTVFRDIRELLCYRGIFPANIFIHVQSASDPPKNSQYWNLYRFPVNGAKQLTKLTFLQVGQKSFRTALQWGLVFFCDRGVEPEALI